MKIAKFHKKVISSGRRSYGERDQGLMESLAVLMKLDIFTDDGRTADRPNEEIGSMITKDISIHLSQSGRNFVNVAKNYSPGNWFIQYTTLNEQIVARSGFQQDDLDRGDPLVF